MTTVDTYDAGQHCKSCSATVIWAQTITGKAMLVDAIGSLHGTVQLVARPSRPPLARVVRKDLAFGRTDLRMAHFATCPNATAHRRRKRAHS